MKYNYSNEFHGYSCPREDEYKKTGYCIFHCDKENFTEKEIKEFKDEFWLEFEWQENDEQLKELKFIGFKFPDKFSFERKEFKKPLDFGGAKFGNNANFSYAEFSNGADFMVTEFGNMADFSGAKFGKRGEFMCAKFGNRANFGFAKFDDEADFVDAKFDDGANFMGAEFGNGGAFMGAEFGNRANFDIATFDDGANFEYVTFHSVEFIGNEENKIFKSDKSEVDFSYSNFETPEKVEFVNVNLSKASFLHCKNIDKIGRFEEVDWNDKGTRRPIFDETNAKPNTYKFVAEIYRKLRLNYERDLRFPEAGDFYIGEMEMRREDAKLKNDTIKIHYYLISLYKHFSNYGENYLRPLPWMLGISILFAFIYLFIYAQIVSWNPLNFEFADISWFWEYFEMSILIFIQMPPKDLDMNLLIAFERILGVLFIALFVLSIRRKFKKGGE